MRMDSCPTSMANRIINQSIAMTTIHAVFKFNNLFNCSVFNVSLLKLNVQTFTLKFLKFCIRLMEVRTIFSISIVPIQGAQHLSI